MLVVINFAGLISSIVLASHASTRVGGSYPPLPEVRFLCVRFLLFLLPRQLRPPSSHTGTAGRSHAVSGWAGKVLGPFF